jgi:hypothetical protein
VNTVTADALKPLNEVFTPDSRHSIFVILDPKTGSIRPKTIEDHYSVIKNFNLDNTVPEEIYTHFETARNLLLYAWFVYRFIPVAEMQAYSSLEFALRARISQYDHESSHL